MSKIIKQKERGSLIVMSGPSGCGKSTFNQLLLQKRDNIVMSISDTFRTLQTVRLCSIFFSSI